LSRGRFWVGAFAALFAIGAAGVSIGSVPIPLSEVWLALSGQAEPTADAIIRTLRLPRVVLAALIGAGLAASGSALQGVMRNPLAEPYLLGVSGGAATGAVAAVTIFDAGGAVVPIAAFCGAVASVSCVVLVARAAGGRADPRILLMAGVVVGAFANAVIMVLLASAAPDVAQSALWWMMGSVSDADWYTVSWLALYLSAGVLLVAWFAPEIDALSLGEETAAALGVDTDRATWRIFLFASLLAAATVAAAGLVGFVGLVVPHLARAFGMRRHRELLFASALAGAALLIGADIVARTVMPPRELPLGAVTALIGVPYFLMRLRRIR
jgi:iron complex transport system permease protein